MSCVVPVDAGLADIRSAVLALLKEAFGSFPDEHYEHILLAPARGSMLYAVVENNEILAINAFIGHSVQRRGEAGIAYQSCLSATRADQKGKGHFSRIINFAKEDLKQRGGAFIFGFPNHNSAPIFVGKLGFSVADNIPCIALPVPLLNTGMFDQALLLESLANEDRVLFDMYETAEWKRAKDGESFVEHRSFTNYLFGRVEERNRFGLSTRVLVVAGYEVNKPYLFNGLLRQAMRSCGASIARISANSAGPLVAAARIRRSPGLTEPTIAFALNWEVEARLIEACSGLKDVY